jgi:phosphoethanolamine N-methyltransferase
VPGPLPFESASFDVVFSKDAIVHIPDKAALYAHRIQNPRRTSR